MAMETTEVKAESVAFCESAGNVMSRQFVAKNPFSCSLLLQGTEREIGEIGAMRVIKSHAYKAPVSASCGRE